MKWSTSHPSVECLDDSSRNQLHIQPIRRKKIPNARQSTLLSISLSICVLLGKGRAVGIFVLIRGRLLWISFGARPYTKLTRASNWGEVRFGDCGLEVTLFKWFRSMIQSMRVSMTKSVVSSFAESIWKGKAIKSLEKVWHPPPVYHLWNIKVQLIVRIDCL